MRLIPARACAILFLLLLFAVPAAGQNPPAQQGGEDVPTNITSDRMTYSQERDIVVFEGQVEVVRGTMHIWSDKLTAYLEPQDGAKEKPETATPPSQPPAEPGLASGDAKIRMVVAVGNVRMRSDGREGFCGKATYHVASGVMVMEQNPVILDGRNKVVGEVIKFYSQTNRSEVLGGRKRVEATFITKGGSFSAPGMGTSSKSPQQSPPPDGDPSFVRPGPAPKK